MYDNICTCRLHVQNISKYAELVSKLDVWICLAMLETSRDCPKAFGAGESAPLVSWQIDGNCVSLVVNLTRCIIYMIIYNIYMYNDSIYVALKGLYAFRPMAGSPFGRLQGWSGILPTFVACS